MANPWELDKEEINKQKEENKSGSSGILCPKMNVSMTGECHACKKVQELYRTKDPIDKKIAGEKKAKCNWYMAVVFPENKEKLVILQVGKKVGDEILDGADSGDWNDIVNPLAGKGREMTIKKSRDGGFNQYKANPKLQNADWDVPQSVLDSIPNLVDNAISIVEGLEENDLHKITTLKDGESITFRILPWSKDASRKRFIVPIWRHWGYVTQEMIDGTVPMDLTLYEDRKPQSEEKGSPAPWDDSPAVEQSSKVPSCFEKATFFDKTDKICRACSAFVNCGEGIKKAA